MSEKNFILYSNCIVVKGAVQAIICDLQSQKVFNIPLTLANILEDYKSHTIVEIKSVFDHKYDSIIDEYFDFLVSLNLIYFTDNLIYFPKLNLEWNEPFLITNAIIDINENTHQYELSNILLQLEMIRCRHLQIRIFDAKSIQYLKELLVTIEKYGFETVQVIVKFSQECTILEYINLLNSYNKLVLLEIYAVGDKILSSAENTPNNLFLIPIDNISERHCGNISTKSFVSNIKLFTESQHHNTCLNRKISIDVDGNIKNCPSMAQSLGNIKDTTLEEALAHPDFKKYWNIKKDDIAVCRDCEFRHICTDCRAYIENPEDMYSKPLKCGYNPYTAE